MAKNIKEETGAVLEPVEYALQHATTQLNKDLLPKIKEIVKVIAEGDLSRVDELKAILASGSLEGASPDNDIFSMEVQKKGKMLTLDQVLGELLSLISDQEEIEQVPLRN